MKRAHPAGQTALPADTRPSVLICPRKSKLHIQSLIPQSWTINTFKFSSGQAVSKRDPAAPKDTHPTADTLRSWTLPRNASRQRAGAPYLSPPSHSGLLFRAPHSRHRSLRSAPSLFKFTVFLCSFSGPHLHLPLLFEAKKHAMVFHKLLGKSG